MALVDRLRDILRRRDAAIQGLTAEGERAILEEILGDLLRDLEAVLGQPLTIDDVDAMIDAFEGVAAEAARLTETEALTALLDAYQEQSNKHAEAAGITRYVYLGPDDGITRPFCDELVEKWLTVEEIEQLDNQQTGAGTSFVMRGGYNCRHAWMGLPDDQSGEFEHGSVAKANRAAAIARAA